MTSERVPEELTKDIERLLRGQTPVLRESDPGYEGLVETARILNQTLPLFCQARPGYQERLETDLAAQLHNREKEHTRLVDTLVEHMQRIIQQSSRFRNVLSHRRLTAVLATWLVLALAVGSTVVTDNPFNRQPPEPGTPPPTASIPAPSTAPNANLIPPGLVAPGQKPPRGWLYVLDNTGGGETQILLVDPSSGQVMGAFRAGTSPDMVVSPDGSQLYLASSMKDQSVLSIIDTSSGSVIRTVSIPYRQTYTMRTVWSNMAISLDGRRLYIRQLHTMSPGQDVYSVATFDTQTGNFLPEDVLVPSCGTGPLLIGAGERQVIVVCSHTNDLRFLTLDENGALAAPVSTLTLPWKVTSPQQLGSLAGAGLFPDRQMTYTVTPAGVVNFVNVATRQTIRSLDLHLPADRWIPHGATSLSPDGTRLFIGLGKLAERSHPTADQILVIDTETGQQLATITTSQPFWSLTVSPDGSQVYAVNPEGRSLLTIDTVTFEERKTISNIGEMPTHAFTAP